MTTHDHAHATDQPGTADQPPMDDRPSTRDAAGSRESGPTAARDARRRYGQPRTEVPDGEAPAARCRLCDRPFPTRDQHALHLGEVHGDALTAAEQDRYESAREAETDELFLYHLKVIAALGTLYAVLVLVYMVVLSL
ncbi:DUF7410 domain-containing protein [Haloarchaeobius sp. HRN-SO-5]|uniref:DUF7410 domain-containing protein n=1 Tax=Haloarchaeobius sp. HRN-SO-5 TaxID=3446118 RepID=UPI003EBA5DC9